MMHKLVSDLRFAVMTGAALEPFPTPRQSAIGMARTAPKSVQGPACASLREALPLLGFVAWVIALGVSMIALRPDMCLIGHAFLYGEPGLSLYLAEVVLKGEKLYRDLSVPYGPLPIHLHAGLAWFLGNTPSTYLIYCLVLGALHAALAYILLRMSVRRSTAFVISILLTPVFVGVGKIQGRGPFVFAYSPVEACLVVASYIVWQPVPRRSAGRSLLLGLVAGCMQWSKFGTAFFVIASIAAVDALAVLVSRADRRTRLRWCGRLCLVFLGIAAVESCRVVHALMTLPVPIALEVIWPSYTLAHYQAMPESASLWYWRGWTYFVFQQLPIPVGLVLGFLGLGVASARLLKSANAQESEAVFADRLEEFRILLPAIFYVLGSLLLFGHVHLFEKYAWCLGLAAAYILDRWPPLVRSGVLLAWTPSLVLVLKLVFLNPIPSDQIMVEIPRGDRLYMNAQAYEEYQAIGTELERAGLDEPGSPPVPTLPRVSGLHLLHDVPWGLRSACILPEYLRPIDHDEIAQTLTESRMIIARSHLESPRDALAESFTPSLLSIIDERTEEIVPINDYLWIIHLR